MSTQRIAPGGFRELGLVNWIVCRAIARVSGVAEAHLFTTLGRQRGLFRGWLAFASRLMPGGALSRRETELVILRVSHLRDCTYERDHHTRIGARAGLDSAALARVAEGPAAQGWTDRERALIEGTDALVEDGDLDDAVWHRLRGHYAEAELVELCLLVGHYDMLATTIAALRIERDFR
ncbi:MAG: carboxymuconolactone decarboxylase family protein [Polyangiaceae bacterium]|nr:carboxymuconolactone decarboxylase family protein [Polyangiaceae bacterium]